MAGALTQLRNGSWDSDEELIMDQCLCYRGVRYERSPVEVRYLLNLRGRLNKFERDLYRDKPTTHSEEQAAV